MILGPRGSGKSTLIKELLAHDPKALYIDLLRPQIEDQYRRHPEALEQEVMGHDYSWVMIDEVQKLPRLLDTIHYLIEEKKQKFILSGSSARKLKRGASNLMAGRVFIYQLHPFTSLELGDQFELSKAINFGLLPRIYELHDDESKRDFLYSYALTYLKEEIQAEQIVRQLDPFRHFLEVAAQMNSKIINFSKIAREVGVETTTVQNYFSILEDTLIGFYLPSFHRSVRKRQTQSPKFYFFDTGIVRALARTLDFPALPQTSQYGELFETFLILEIRKLASYRKKDWSFSYLRTKDDAEIDLIIDLGSNKRVCIEIKSTNVITKDSLSNFIKISVDIPNSKSFCFSNDIKSKKIAHVHCLYWQSGLQELGLA